MGLMTVGIALTRLYVTVSVSPSVLSRRLRVDALLDQLMLRVRPHAALSPLSLMSYWMTSALMLIDESSRERERDILFTL